MEAQKSKAKRDDKKRKVNEIIDEMDESKLDNTLNLITNLMESSKERINLISSVQQLSEEEIPAADHPIKTMMCYPKGPNEGKLISPYLQNKAYEYTIGQLSMHFTVECTKLIYEYLLGEEPRNWLSTSTLRTWHQDVSHIHVSSQISQIAMAPAFSIMIDESTYIPKCNADTVATTVINTINKDGLDIKKCSLWITDNIAYLSGDKKGAVVLFTINTND
ncbi:hypothetical protein C1646_762283 [Rhizophagus diaphanus]|nr:hypothetical protein C1646_762283 [Rhizophagus diaphanus] [Rhizophagus sp. MUCL 43196]